MNKNSATQSETDWARVDAMRDEDIDLTDHPEWTAADFARAQLRVGGVPVQRGKVDIELQLSAWLVEYFRQQAGERDPAALINQVLKQSVVDDTARRIAEKFREEGEHQPVLA